MSQQEIMIGIIASLHAIVTLVIVVKISFDWGFRKGLEWDGNLPRHKFKIKNKAEGGE